MNEAVAISVASRAQEAGKIGLAVTAYNLANHTTLGAPGVAGIYGRVKWNAALFVFDGAGLGDFLRQGGVEPSCCSPGEVHIEPNEGTFPFSVQRRPGTPGVTGSGEIVLLRLRPRDGVVEGTSRIEFTAIAPIWPELIRFRPLPTYAVPQNVYGGTLTIR